MKVAEMPSDYVCGHDPIARQCFGTEGLLPAGTVMTETPASLLARLRQPGDKAAWDHLVELYTPLLYYWARRMGLQESDAADLVQDVFTILVQKLPEFTYDPHNSFRAWLRTIVEGSRQKAEGRNQDKAHLRPLPSAFCLLPLEDAAWEAEYRHHLARRALEIMKSDFQPTTWKACWETLVSGRPTTDVAAELGVSPGAVRAAKFRVLRRLQQELEGLLD